MGLEETDIAELRRETTQQIGGEELVESSTSATEVARPAMEASEAGRPPPVPGQPTPRQPMRDPVQHARDWIEECERELRLQPDDRRAARLYYEMGRMCELPLKDGRRALQLYREAVELASDYVPAIRAARRLLLGARMYPEALVLFDAEARVTRKPRNKATLYLLKGRLLEDVLGNREGADAAYQTAHALDRTHAAILRASEQRAFARRTWPEVDRQLAELANTASSDGPHRAALIIRRAQLLESRQQRPEQAAELYETALQLDPNATVAVQALKRLYYGQRRWRDLIRTLETEARLARDEHVRASSLYRAARVHAERLGNRDEAIRVLEQARSAQPTDPLILGELARHYESSQRFEALVETLEALVEASEDAAEKLTFTQRIARLYEEELRDVDQAIAWHERAVQLNATSLSSLQALGLLYRVRGAWPKLIAMYVREARHTSDAQRRADAHARAGEIFETKLSATDEAIDHYHRALAAIPEHAMAFKALARLLSDARRPKELIRLYENALDRATGTRAVSYLFKIAQVYEDILAEHALAAQTYRRVLQHDSAHLAAVHAWQRSAARAQRPRELLEALDYEIGLTVERDRLVNLLHRSGEVLSEQLGDRDEAIGRFRRALEKDARHVPTLSSLGRLYYAAGRWNDLLDVYGRELRLTASKGRRVALLEKMAEISRDRLGSDEEALRYHREAIKIDPTHAPSLQELSRQLRERGAWEELIDVLELQLRNSAEPIARARAAFVLGQVYEEHVDDPSKAMTSYETSVSADATYRPAVDALARVRAQQHDWTRLLSDLDREIKLTEDEGQLVARHARKAQVLEQQDKHRQAIQAWEDVLALDSGNLGALLAVEQLYRQVGAWESLASVYARQAEVVEEPAGRIAALYELARLQEQQGIGGYEETVDSFRRVLEIAPADLGALLELERLASEHSDVALLREVDTLGAASAQEPAIVAAHRTRLAEAVEGEEDAEAIEQFRAAVNADPHNVGAARGLTRVAQETNDPAALVDALRREAETERDAKTAAELYLQSAFVRLERVRDHAGARGDFERALELWPDSRKAADGLIDVLAVEEEWSALVDRLSQAASGARTVERATALWLTVSRIQSDELAQMAPATQALQRVLKLDPRNLDALERLAHLFRANHSWHEAAGTMEQLLSSTEDPVRTRRVQLDLAAMYHERLNMPDKALAHIESVLEDSPDELAALQELSIVHEKLGQLPEALQVARHLLGADQEPEHQSQALLRLGHLEETAGHRAEAQEVLRRALMLQGVGGEAAERLKALCETKGDWRAYVEALQGFETSDLEEATAVTLEIAHVLSDHCEDDTRAISALQWALENGSRSVDIEKELAVRLRARGQDHTAIEHLQEALLRAPLRPELWRELAVSYEALGKAYQARIASAPLVVLGEDDEEDRRRYAAVPPRPAHARPKALRGPILDQLGTPRPEDRLAGDLLSVLSPALAKLYPPDLESYGLQNRDRLATEANHPLRDLANRIAATLDVHRFDLFLHRARNRGVSVEFGVQPALLLPTTIMERSPAEQTFMLAKPLTQIARGYHAIEKLTPRELDVLLACAARIVQPAYGAGLTSEEFLSEQARRLQRAIPRRDRKRVREAAAAYADADRVKFSRWVRSAHRTATRVALLLSDELGPLLDEVGANLPAETATEGMKLENHPTFVDALGFWASAAAMHLREHLGMIPPVDG